uniref:Retrotransposon gag domain-containing protein n=1 Tax=Fagus sylvatica TaxID=28930 RepID=A0A2N9IQP5_FAGSY
MAEEREEVVPHEAPRRTMYELLHLTQSSIPSCIMFSPNAPHMEIKQGLMAILHYFRGLENENLYVHDKAKGWLYTLKPRSIGNWGEMTQEFYKKFFPPHKVQQKELEDAMDYLDEIAENSNTWNGPSPLDSTNRYRSSTTTSGGSVFRLREEDNMSAKISLLTKEIEALKLKGSRGVNVVFREEPMEACEQNQRFETMFTRIDEEMRETKSQVARLTDALSKTERGKLPSQTQPNPNNQSAKVVNKEKYEEVMFVTILRSAKSNDIEKCPFPTPFLQALKLPKNLDVTSEILEHLHQVKVNLPLLHIIKQMPLYAKILEKKKKQVVEAKKPSRSKKKSLHAYPDAPKLKLKQPPRDLPYTSIEPHATSIVEVPLKMSVDQEVEKIGEKTKIFERHKTKRKTLQDTRLSNKLLNNSKGVELPVARMKSARGKNYSFGGSRSGG